MAGLACVYEGYVSVLTDEYGVGGVHMVGAIVCAVSKHMMVCTYGGG